MYGHAKSTSMTDYSSNLSYIITITFIPLCTVSYRVIATAHFLLVKEKLVR